MLKISGRAASFAVKIGRLPVPVKSSPGFLVNRILMPYTLEAVALLKEGVPGPLIDKVATEIGMPHGADHISRYSRPGYLLSRR